MDPQKIHPLDAMWNTKRGQSMKRPIIVQGEMVQTFSKHRKAATGLNLLV